MTAKLCWYVERNNIPFFLTILQNQIKVKLGVTKSDAKEELNILDNQLYINYINNIILWTINKIKNTLNNRTERHTGRSSRPCSDWLVIHCPVSP